MIANRVHRASFVKRMSKNGTRMGSTAARKRAGKRLVAFNAARKRGLTKAGAMRAATRAVGGSKKKRSSTKRRLRPNLSRSMSRAQSAAYSAGYAKTFGKKKKRKTKAKAKRRSKTAARRAAPKRRKTRRGTPEQVAARKAKRAAMSARKKARRAATSARKKEVSARKKARAAARRAKMSTPEARRRRAKASRRARWPKQVRSTKARKRARVAYGPYRRARITDPRTGARKYSYMTRKGGKLRRIPQWAVAGAMSAKDYKTSAEYTAARARIAKRRRAAAARLERAGDAFTPNAGAKRVAKARKRKAKKGSRRKARRSKSTKRRTSKRTSAKRGKRRVKRKTKRVSAKRGKRRVKRRKSAKRGRRKTKRVSAKRGRRKSTKRRATSKRGRRKSTKRRSTRRVGKRKVRRLRKGLYLVANRRRRRHKLSPNRRRHGRRKMRRNGRRYIRNGFGSDIKSLLKTGGLILTGFFSHKVLTGLLLNNALTSADGSKVLFMPAVNADGTPSFAAQWKKPIAGLVVGGLELALLSWKGMPGKTESKMAVGAGVMVSWLESLIKTGLAVANQPQALSYLEGYSNSAAYSLRGARGRRGMRGLGVARNAGSIMPQYAPVGMFRQASAGMGEYFKPVSGVGEYFAGPGVQGVGHYEKAGSLALMPSRSHMGQLPVDDGIRPDANLDNIMDLAESAAGLGGGGGYTQAAAGIGQYRQAAAGMGEFFTASPGAGGGFAESRVPTQSQWIPSGPLWAGSTPAEAAYTESELPAGILQGPGGNGVLSGG